MKKCVLVLIFLISLLLEACQKTHTAHIDGLILHDVELDTTYTLGKEASAPSCHVAIQMQYAEGKHAKEINAIVLSSGTLPPEYQPAGCTDIRSAVKAFADQYIRSYRDTNQPLYKYDQNNSKAYAQRFQLTVSTFARCQDILTYSATIKMQAGEQPETTQTTVRNIDTKNGHVLSLSDIYMHGAEEEVKAVIIKKLAKSHGTNGLDGLRDRQIFAESEVYIPDNFIIYRDKVTFIYQQGEIAPHDEGEIRITVSRSDIGKLMKQDITTTSNNTL